MENESLDQIKECFEQLIVPEEFAINCDTAAECISCFNKNQDITFNSCEDIKNFTIQNVSLIGAGRLLKIKVQLKNVCRGRSIRMGVLLCEKINNAYHLKGLRVCEFTIPGDFGTCLDNITVGDFCFVIPEDNLCKPQDITVHIIAHYSSFPNFQLCPLP